MQSQDTAERGEYGFGRVPHGEDAVAKHGHRGRHARGVAGGERRADPGREKTARFGEAAREPHEIVEAARLLPRKCRTDAGHRLVGVEDPGGRDRPERDGPDRLVRRYPEDLCPDPGAAPDHDPASLLGCRVAEPGPEPDLGLVRRRRDLGAGEIEAVEGREGGAGREKGRRRETEARADRQVAVRGECGRGSETLHQVLDRR